MHNRGINGEGKPIGHSANPDSPGNGCNNGVSKRDEFISVHCISVQDVFVPFVSLEPVYLLPVSLICSFAC